MSSERYGFGTFTLDTARASLDRDGAVIALRPKSFALLNYLVTHAGRVVLKDELFAALWAGLVVTDDSLSRCVSDLRAALGDDAQSIIKTVPKRGYLFDAPVTVLDSAAPAPPPASAQPSSIVPTLTTRRPRHLGLWVALGAWLLVVAVSTCPGARSRSPQRLSLGVIPFATLGDEPQQASVADAVTEDLTGALARLHGLRVIAASSALTLRDRPADVQKIGNELGVRYVIQGTVLRTEGRLRINARLVDAQSAITQWADQFDVSRADQLEALDEIVLRLANALDVELVRAESHRTTLGDAAALDAEDLAMQCVSAARRSSASERETTYRLCDQALLKNPDNVRALVRLGSYYAGRVSRGQTRDAAGDLARARSYTTRALNIDPAYDAAHCAHAAVLEGEHRVREAIIAAQRCLALNPSNADAYLMLAIENFFLAEPDHVLEYVDKGMRLSPRDPRLSTFLLFRGWAYLQQGRGEDAVTCLRQAKSVSPNSPNILLALTAALGISGHADDARATMTSYLGLQRTQARTIAQFDHRPDDNPTFQRFAARNEVAWRQAGMPAR